MAEGDLPIFSSRVYTDEGHVFRGFIPADHANFNIKNYVLSRVRDGPFEENAIKDPWAHLARLSKTASMLQT